MTRHHIPALLIATLAAFGSGAGCSSNSCQTASTCADIFTVNLREPIDVEAPVTLEIEVDGHFQTCEVGTQSKDCGTAQLTIIGGKLEAIWFWGSRRELTLNIYRGDETLIQRTIPNEVAAKTSAQNEDCEPQPCNGGHVDL